jgi:hypothetical protein
MNIMIKLKDASYKAVKKKVATLGKTNIEESPWIIHS